MKDFANAALEPELVEVTTAALTRAIAQSLGGIDPSYREIWRASARSWRIARAPLITSGK